jgi:hypothetical protein
MSVPYTRAASDGFRVVDDWDGGFGWQAHPDEPGERTSHAVAADEGVWLFDPLDAPGIDERIATLGDIAGVAVLADYHTRDAAALARRHDVPVTVPTWLSRVADRVDAPVDRVSGSVAGFELRRLRPLWAWRETVAYRERDGTLYVPDFLSTHAKFTAGDERLGLPTFSRLAPPRERLDCEPDRILLGHGTGIFTDATGTLRKTLRGARRRFPRALVWNLPGELRAMAGALQG